MLSNLVSTIYIDAQLIDFDFSSRYSVLSIEAISSTNVLMPTTKVSLLSFAHFVLKEFA